MRTDDEGWFPVNPLVHRRPNGRTIYCRPNFVVVHSVPTPSTFRVVEYRIQFQEEVDYLNHANKIRQFRIQIGMRNVDTFFMKIPNYLYGIEGLESHIAVDFLDTILQRRKVIPRKVLMNALLTRQRFGKCWRLYGFDPQQDGPTVITAVEHIETFSPATPTAPVTHDTSRVEYRLLNGTKQSVGISYTDGNQWFMNLANDILAPDTLRRLTPGTLKTNQR